MRISLQKKLGRAAGLGLSAAVFGLVGLVGLAPAAAAPGDRFAITGAVNAAAADGGLAPLAGVEVSVSFTEPGESGSRYPTTSAADGTFAFAENQTFPLGTYDVVFALDGYDTMSVPVEIVDADVVMAPVTMVPTPAALPTGSVSITGEPIVGSVLTAVTDGWPTGTTFTYQWFHHGGNWGNELDSTTSSYTVTNATINTWIGVSVTGSKPGYSASNVSFTLDAVAVAPQKAPAPAPSDVTAYLKANGSTPMSQTAAGLPAGALDTSVAHTATLEWFAQDSFVDVYAFSSPVFVGTFPVVNGAVQITLTPAVLSQLAAGDHTLVVTGQTSGTVASVALAVGVSVLPVTGAGSVLPVSIASGLLLLGAALVLVRRRMTVTA